MATVNASLTLLYAKNKSKPFYFCLWYNTRPFLSILNLSTRPMIIKENSSQDRDGLPPFVNSWKQLYTLLIGMLVLQIVLFYLFMTRFQ